MSLPSFTPAASLSPTSSTHSGSTAGSDYIVESNGTKTLEVFVLEQQHDHGILLTAVRGVNLYL
jgi:hypothetical protein